MDWVEEKFGGRHGTSLDRTLQERRKRPLRRGRSSSRKPHVDHFHQKLYGGHSRPVKTTAMLAMMILSPFFVVFLLYTMVHTEGAVDKAYYYFYTRGWRGFKNVWPLPTMRAVKLILSFAVFEAVLLIALPGERYLGPTSPAGNRPLYKKNGVPCYLTTLAVYYLLWKEKVFNPALVYDMCGELLSVLIVASYVVTTLLYFKGHMAPSSTDWGSSGNVLIDFFWGMELYPRISRHFDVKVFLNCRFGMMSWAIIVISFAIKQYDTQGKISDSMMVTSLLMLVYITKFFWTEGGFFSSMEIAHDRAGWFIVWTCLTWIPAVYPAVNLYLVAHPIQLGRGVLYFTHPDYITDYMNNRIRNTIKGCGGTQVALTMFAAGLACIYVVWDCDRQRQMFRNSHGKCRIWGKVPSKIQAHYVTEWGEHKQSLLLTAGWWSIARHFQYAPEIGAAFFWTLPALFRHAMPYFYVTFLTALLIDRANRDDKNCKLKYHKYWEAYCKRVRFKIIPRVY